MQEVGYKCEVCGRTCTQGELDAGEDDAVCRECVEMREEEVAEAEKVEHTPGPWKVGGPYPSVSVVVCVAGSGSGDEPPIYEPVCIVDGRTTGKPDKQALADAHLIAAAPALAEALLAITDAHQLLVEDEYSGTDLFSERMKVVEQARTALALPRLTLSGMRCMWRWCLWWRA
jgi:hypothetical protein